MAQRWIVKDDDLRHWDSDRVRANHDDDHNYEADDDLDRWLLWWAVLGCLGLILIGAIFGAIIFRLIRT